MPDFRIGRGSLSLTPTVDATNNLAAAVLARTTTTGDYVATAVVDLRGMSNDGMAGLAAYGDAENALVLGVVKGGAGVANWRVEKNKVEAGTTIAFEGSQRTQLLHLRMTAREGHIYRFAVSKDGRAWTDVGEEMDGAYLPPWDRGVRVALVAGGARHVTARFESLRIEPAR